MREEIRSQGDESWMSEAACKNPAYDKSWWFPEVGGKPATAMKAKRICESCPVVLPCLTFGTQNNEMGIWGGMNAAERRAYAAEVEHEQALICHNCRDEFVSNAKGRQRNIFCSRFCRNQSFRGVTHHREKR